MIAGHSSELRPLTSLQRSTVLASIRAPAAGAYVIQRISELAEEIQVPLLKRAWELLMQRHPALRTSVVIDSGGGLWQQVNEKPEISWCELDWTGVEPAQREEKLAAFLLRDWERGFNFDEGVPARFTLLRNSERSYTLIWTSHHVLLDGGSIPIVWREWFALYYGLLRGEAVQLVEPQPFSVYLDWLEGQDLAKAERFWREYLAGLSQTTDYVVDRMLPAGALGGQGFAKEGICLSQEVTQELWNFARRQGITVNLLVQGAWALLLSRYSGRSDVVFGVTRAGRHSAVPGAENIVGVMINTLPVRIPVNPEESLIPWLKQIRSRWIAMREYEHTPLEKVWEWSGLPKGMPPFESVVVYDQEPLSETIRQPLSRVQRTDSPLTLVAYGRPVLSLEIVYDTRLFSRPTIAGMTGHLQTLLRSFVAQPDSHLGALKMLTEREERCIVQEWNQTDAPPVADLCVHQLFEQQAHRVPLHAAVDHARGSILYQKLNGRANQLARVLREKGAGPEDLIAVCMERSPQVVVAILAILKAGAAFLPLSPDLPSGRLLSMLADARPKFVLGREGLSLDRLQAESAKQSEENLPNAVTPANAAYAIFTSGSTGKPKAVVVTHRSLVNHTVEASRVYGLSEADRRLQFASLGTDFFIAELFNYLCSGATLVFCLDRQGSSVKEFLRLLDQHRITITGIPSTWWHEWVATISEGGFALPTSLRAMITGMERVNPKAFSTWKRVIGNRIRWFNAYGPTETTCTATIYQAGSSVWEDGPFVPIGRPLANTQAYVLDGDRNPVPVGVSGELYIGGEGVARGYLNAPDLTSQRFLPNPFRGNPEDRLYRTGDVVFYLPDGNLVFLGRTDRQVKIRGFRVELEEVETLLAEHPGVRQCAVVVAGKESQQSLVAYVTANGGEAPAPAQLRLHLSRYLPAHMLPAGFVTLPKMPLTSSGKIDRQSLPPYDPARPVPEETFQEPSTPTEQHLVRLWQEVLGVKRIGVTDNFFDLGGDSLGATQLLTLIDEEFGKELPLAILFRAPTIVRMAAALDVGGSAAPWQSLVAIQEGGSRSPLFCMHAESGEVLFYRQLAQHLGPDQPVYGLRSVGLDGSTPTPETVEAMAAYYIREMRDLQPEGPYHVGGFCLGAYVALEVGRQLQQQGCEVALLACFDTDSLWKTARSSLDRLAIHLQILQTANGGAKADYIMERARFRLTRIKRTMVEVVHKLLKASGRPIPPGLRRAHVREINLRAGRIYRAGAFQGRLTYFQPAGATPKDPTRFWGPLAPGGMDIRTVPGRGLGMFQEPHVAALAHSLSDALERARNANRR